MKLIADSGSTKTSWQIIDVNGGVKTLQTKGINPFFRSSDDIELELRNELLPNANNAKEVYFYGAGIVNSQKAAIVVHAIQQIYGNIPIESHSDIIGAARAACGTDAGIVCVLGTGSNSCYYDGRSVVDRIPALGYILGDEGSGVAMGKNLLGDYFKKVMPNELRDLFQKRFSVNEELVLEQVYRNEKPNHYIAGFSVFLSENIKEDYCQNLVLQSFRNFIIRNVKTQPESVKLPIHFVGTVAFVFQDLLKKVLHDEKLVLGNIVKEPIEGLLSFHQNNK